MKVIHINTYSDFGGAGIACKRISDSLNQIVPQSSLILNKDSFYPSHSSNKILNSSSLTKINFAADILLSQIMGVKKSFKFSYSLGRFGLSMNSSIFLKNADIIHLHWFNQGFLSLKSLEQLSQLDKPIVWTLHDMWGFTGGCHYSGSCLNFKQDCGNCFMIRNPNGNDISRKQSKFKKKIYKKFNLNLVAPSNWIGDCARKSSLFRNFPIQVIPNPIDINLFKPQDSIFVRQKLGWLENEFVIIMNAFKISNERKGLPLFLEALKILSIRNSSLVNFFRIVFIGENEVIKEFEMPFRTEFTGYIKNENKLIEYNQAADMYVTPSLEDNLPNTIMEALACGLPTVAFNVGGIGDLIEHKITGYLAEPKSSYDLANGIEWVFQNLKTLNSLKKASREKAVRDFNFLKIGSEYLKLYNRIY